MGGRTGANVPPSREALAFANRAFSMEARVLEEQIVEAIKSELQRQASDRPSDLSVDITEGFRVNGVIDLDALAMAVAGSVAGGP